MADAHRAPRPRAASRLLERSLRARSASVRGKLLAAAAAGTAGGAALIAQCWLVAWVLDDAIVRGGGLRSAAPALLALPAAFVLRAVLAVASDLLAFEAGARVVADVRAGLEAHLASLGPTRIRLRRAGTLAETIVSASEGIGRYHGAYLPQRALAATVPLAILAFVLPTDWVSALIMTLSAPLIPLFMIIIGKGTEALNQAQWRTLARLGGHVFDRIEGLTTLRLFGAARAEIAAVASLSDAYRAATMGVLRVAFLSSLALEFLATVSIAMVAVYVGFRLYYGEMRLLPGLAVLLVAPEFYRVLRGLGTQYHARMDALAAAEQVAALLAETPAPGCDGDAAPPCAAAAAAPTVRFERVTFRRDGIAVLDGLDLALRPGRVVALAGPSGAGKTTAADLLLGFLLPDGGRITADGVDLRSLSMAPWRAAIGFLAQSPTLFHGTIGDNVRLGRPNAPDALVWDALRRAEADGIARARPDGLGAMLGERGQGLSGGEIRRIALARAFLKDATLLLLDEPTAGLDAALAARVARAIRDAAAGRAALVITHDPVMLDAADEIVALGRAAPPGAAAAAA